MLKIGDLSNQKIGEVQMLVHEGNHIGDSWFFVEGDRVHCYYLTCPVSVERHTAWDIAHAVSYNMVDWSGHEIVVEKGRPGQWDDTCLATGSVIEKDGNYWMAYTAKWDKPDVAVGLAVSEDLYIWEKCSWNPITTVDERFYERTGSGKRAMTHWRDPQLFTSDCYVYHAVCASRNTGRPDARGTVGLARTTDMKHWEVVAPLEIEPVVQEMECPQILPEADGRYLLVFSSFYELFCGDLKKHMGPDTLRHSAYCMWSDSLLGPYHFDYREPIIPKELPVQPYAVQVVEFHGGTYLLGTVWDFAGDEDYISDPIPVYSDGTRYVPMKTGL